MDWKTVKGSLQSVFAQITGLQTSWRDKSQTDVGDTERGGIAQCTLTLGNFHGVAWDEFRMAFNTTTGQFDNPQNGIREFNVTVLVEAYQADDNDDCMEYISRVTAALERPQILDNLRNASGVCIIDVSATRDHTHYEDDRAVNAASVDVRCSIMDNLTQGDVGPGNGLDPVPPIQHVQITGTITDTDGITTTTVEIDE